MIVVVEGPSAAGKSTWVSRFDSAMVVPENGRLELPPNQSSEERADFWVEKNCARWAGAVNVERSRGIAVCDTDPLKLHYDYSLARAGEVPWEVFSLSVSRCRAAMCNQLLGIADVILVSFPDDARLERNRRSDVARSRRNFELHRRFTPALRDWYTGLFELDPARVVWSPPGELPKPFTRPRFDLDLFDEWMRALPKGPL